MINYADSNNGSVKNESHFQIVEVLVTKETLCHSKYLEILQMSPGHKRIK